MTERTPAGRDLTLDLARVVCVLLVVFVHVLFTGVGRDAAGDIVIERTVEAEPWFDVASWIANIMPLFFVVGGFAARVGWRSTVQRGGDEDGFVRVRLARLARPTVPVFLFFTAALAAARLVGVEPAFVDTIAIGVGSPLWFLAGYMLVQALAPRMIALHERRPVRTLALLLAAAMLFDAVRFWFGAGVLGLDRIDVRTYGVGEELFGIPNILFVWLFAQQIGFWMADGWFRRRTWWQLAAVAACAYAVSIGLVSAGRAAIGAYSWSMLGNQWPPTAPLAVLAVAQAAILTLLHTPLSAFMRTAVGRGFVFVIGSRLMTVYLWHLPVIMVLIGIQLLLPLPMPSPGSPMWWLTRVPFTILVIAVVWLLSLWLVRFERPFADGPSRVAGPWATPLAVVLFVLAPLAVTAYGLDVWFAAAGLLLTLASLCLIAPRQARVPAAG